MFVLNEVNSIASKMLLELRDVSIQQNALVFRNNLTRLGEIMAYEISKTLEYKRVKMNTPLAEMEHTDLNDYPVVGTILRAGLPFHQGFLNYFDKSQCAFIGAARGAHLQDNTFEIDLGYTAFPGLEGKVLIMTDPMIATGKSLVKSCEEIMKFGHPSRIILVGVVGSKSGVEYLKEKLPKAEIWLCALDPMLNSQFYIVPGLGDAGDLAFGPKV